MGRTPIGIKKSLFFSNYKMKTFAVALVAAASADKKVPPRHPLQRLARLNEFAAEWCIDNLTVKQATNWSRKFNNIVARFERRFERCGFYDENQLPHGGPARKRRDTDDLVENCEDAQNPLCRYDKSNPLHGIKQITNGFRKWAERYLANDKDGDFCKKQPQRQVTRAYAWFDALSNKQFNRQTSHFAQLHNHHNSLRKTTTQKLHELIIPSSFVYCISKLYKKKLILA